MSESNFAKLARTPATRITEKTKFLRDLENRQYYAKQEILQRQEETRNKVAKLSDAYSRRR